MQTEDPFEMPTDDINVCTVSDDECMLGTSMGFPYFTATIDRPVGDNGALFWEFAAASLACSSHTEEDDCVK